MSRDSRESYSFNGYTLDVGRSCLLRNGREVRLRPKSFEVLTFLVQNRGRLITKEELIQAVWPDTSITENSVFQCLKEVRRALGDTDQQVIKTVARRGYIFDAEVVEQTSSSSAADSAQPEARVIEKREGEPLPSPDKRDLSPDLAPDLAKLGTRAGDNGGVRHGGRNGESSSRAGLLQGLGTSSRPITPGFADSEPAAPPARHPEPRIDEAEQAGDARLMGQAGSPHPNAGALTAPTRRKTAKMGIAGLLVITAAGVALYGFVSLGWLRDDSKELHQKMTITGLATTGDISCVAVSPDGKYVAYGVKEKPHLSTLWVMQPATSARQEILPPSEAQYHALTFSPDGSYLYFVRVDPNIGRTLYRVPALGGVPKKLIESVDTAISFSPDGKQFVFRRSLNTRREAILAIANADGTGEKEVAAIAYPEYFGDPAWSPDGKVIACAAGHAGGGINMYVVTVSVGDWTVNQISPQRWRWVGQMDWLSDSSGVVMLATENPTAPIQIWRLSYPNGETRRITNDANDYNRMSMSADSRVLVALQSQQLSNVWVIPRDEAGGLRQITSGAGGYRTGLSWTADGKLIYDSEAGGATSISVMNADGRDPKLLLGDLTGLGIVGESRASPDGRYILYATDITGSRHIWRMNRDGSNPIQVTNGEREDNPSWSPDGRWVVFTSLETATSKRPTIWKAPIDGGDPVQIADAYTICPAVSPDGKLIACFYTESMTSRTMRIALYPFAGGQPVKVYDTPVHGWPYLRWTPDGLGLTYADNPAGPAKIWIQPVDGGPPKEFARFETDRVFGFDWSPDGTALACVRGMWAKDAVLIRDFN